MSQYTSLLASKEETIGTQKMTIIALSLFIAMLIAALMVLPKKITVHVPPDISAGLVTGIKNIPEANVYTFAYYIFQQLNRWPVDGSDDYEKRIHALRNYMTPACYQDRLDDRVRRENANELRRRERSLWEIPGRGYTRERVIRESNGSWLVSLDVQIQETMLGEPVKERLVNFPLRVVTYNVDYELNPYQMALDCLNGPATAIETHDTAPAAIAHNL